MSRIWISRPATRARMAGPGTWSPGHRRVPSAHWRAGKRDTEISCLTARSLIQVKLGLVFFNRGDVIQRNEHR